MSSSTAKTRLAFACAVTIAWIGFLLYEVITTANPVILSRPQILAASVIVEGVAADGESIKVDKVWWGDPKLQGTQLKLTSPLDLAPGARLIAPLEPTGEESVYRIAPPATGFEKMRTAQRSGKIYPATAEAIRQLQRLTDWRKQMISKEQGDDASS